MSGMSTDAPAIAADAYPNLLQVVKARRSVRKFEPGRDVPRETLLRILEAGRWAPSGANAQHWDFICVDDPDGARAGPRGVPAPGRRGCGPRSSASRP